MKSKNIIREVEQIKYLTNLNIVHIVGHLRQRLFRVLGHLLGLLKTGGEFVTLLESVALVLLGMLDRFQRVGELFD